MALCPNRRIPTDSFTTLELQDQEIGEVYAAIDFQAPNL